MEPTIASTIPAPETFVTLEKLPDAEGQPVVVVAERISELEYAEVVGAWPGGAPAIEAAAAMNELDQIRAVVRLAPGLIERGTALRREDGTRIRPAFSSAEPPPPGSLPMRWLADQDKVRLALAILRVSGVIGGAVDGLSFRDGDGEGLGAGGGALGDVQGDPDAAAPTAPSEPGEAAGAAADAHG